MLVPLCQIRIMPSAATASFVSPFYIGVWRIWISWVYSNLLLMFDYLFQGAKIKWKETTRFTQRKVGLLPHFVTMNAIIFFHFVTLKANSIRFIWVLNLNFTALAVPPLLAAMGYEPTNGGWQLRAGARNFYWPKILSTGFSTGFWSTTCCFLVKLGMLQIAGISLPSILVSCSDQEIFVNLVVHKYGDNFVEVFEGSLFNWRSVVLSFHKAP